MEPWWGLRSSVTGVESTHPPILGRSSLGLDEDWQPRDQCPEHERQGRGLPQAWVLTPRPPSGLLRTGMRG